jgi:hypothetical protein
MNLKHGDLVFEAELNRFDLKNREFTHSISPIIANPENPIGVYRIIFKNGIPIDSWIQPIQN